MKKIVLLALSGLFSPAFAQSLARVDLNNSDTIYVSASHVSYIDPRNIELLELDYKCPYIGIEKTSSNILKIVAIGDFSNKTPNYYPIAFITPDNTIIKILKYNPSRQAYLYGFSIADKQSGQDEISNPAPAFPKPEKAAEKTARDGSIPEGQKEFFRRLRMEEQNAYIPFFKNKIEACIGGIRHDNDYYYFIIKIVNKGNKPFALDYCHMTLQEDSGKKLKNSVSQIKAIDALILNKTTLMKNQQEHIVVRTPLINVNDGSFLLLELFDNESSYDKEDVRTISFKIKNNEISVSKPLI